MTESDGSIDGSIEDGHKVHEDYSATSADFTIISRDNVEFRIQKYYLLAASPVFRDMSKDLNLSDEQLVLKSPASVVAMFLDLITGRPIQLDLGIPIQNPDTYTLVQTAGEALRLCGEYECSSAIKFCLISLRDFLEVADGILTERIFLLACEFGDTEMAIRAVNFFYKLENKGKQNLHERRGRGEPHLESEGSPRVHFEVDPFIGWDLTAMSLENFQKIPHTVILAYLRTIQFQLIVRASELRKLPWDKISDYMRLMVRGQRKIEDSQIFRAEMDDKMENTGDD